MPPITQLYQLRSSSATGNPIRPREAAVPREIDLESDGSGTKEKKAYVKAESLLWHNV